MPRQTRQLVEDSREGARNPSTELTAAIREYLLYGTGPTHEETMLMVYGLGPVRRYPQNIGLIWKKHRKKLIKEYKKENNGHGMPEAWWKYEAPERRKIISGNKYLVIHADWNGNLPGNRGLPCSYRADPEFEDTPGGYGVPRKNPPVFESETDYLKRLGMW